MAKTKSKFQQKLDGFLRVLFLDENGKPKSATVLYSFLLAVLFIGLYAAAYLLLLDPLEAAFASLPTWLRNVAEYAIPAIVGSVVPVVLALLLKKQQRLVPCAFLWMAGLFAAMCLAELVLIDWSDAATEYALFFVLLGLPSLLSIVFGGVPVALLYRRALRRQAAEAQKAPTRPSYYNT
ncbi:MAG: hypothetical protein IJP98_05920 [Clostridia bacterium]|nr:hypothetical protein [Clostridia bacterium]